VEHYLPLVCLSLFLAGTAWRIRTHRHRHGRSGVMLFRSGHRTQNLHDATVLLVVGALGVQAVLIAVRPGALESLAPFGVARAAAWRWVGAGLALAGMAASLLAQAMLGASWRIGIEEEARPGLITTGLYGWSRNPIFTFMLVVLAGFVVLMPTWPSLLAFGVGAVEIRRQVRVEEEWLLRAYGREYREYARRVGRFLPRFGRLD